MSKPTATETEPADIMPVFTYQAVGNDGRKSNGTLSANNRAAALDRIATLGLYPTQVAEKSDRRQASRAQAADSNGSAGATPTTRLSPAATETFTRELADLLAAGVPLVHPRNRQSNLSKRVEVL